MLDILLRVFGSRILIAENANGYTIADELLVHQYILHDLPSAGIPAGKATLEVIANGIASQPMGITIPLVAPSPPK